MSPKRKPPKHFVSASYARSKWAISQVEKLLKQQNYAIILKEEDYGPDIKAIKDSVIKLYEVKTKTQYTWTNEHDFHLPQLAFLPEKRNGKI